MLKFKWVMIAIVLITGYQFVLIKIDSFLFRFICACIGGLIIGACCTHGYNSDKELENAKNNIAMLIEYLREKVILERDVIDE
jgi:hypothetical protein